MKLAAARLQVNVSVTIIPCEDHEEQWAPVEVTLNDVSTRGVRFTHNKPLPPGCQLVIRLPREGQTEVSFLCMIVHARILARDSYQFGAEFDCIVPEHGPNVTDEEIARAQIRRSILN